VWKLLLLFVVALPAATLYGLYRARKAWMARPEALARRAQQEDARTDELTTQLDEELGNPSRRSRARLLYESPEYRRAMELKVKVASGHDPADVTRYVQALKDLERKKQELGLLSEG